MNSKPRTPVAEAARGTDGAPRPSDGKPRPSGGTSRGAYRRAARKAASARPIPGPVVLEVLDGCATAAASEASELGRVTTVSATELRLEPDEGTALADLTGLRRAVAAYVSIPVAGHRPRAILETSKLQQIAATAEQLRAARPKNARFTAARLEAAGSGTPEMRRIADAMAETIGLPLDSEDGDLLLRLRRDASSADGWELLLRTTPRPLSTRSWRTVDYPGAVNGTIAATVMDILGVGPDDALLDMMCGSGTFLIEQLADAAPRRAVGVDVNRSAIDAAREHQRAARRKGRIDWVEADVLDPSAAGLEPGFTRIIVNPPWGTLHGSHETNEELHTQLLDRAAELAAPRARLGVLTHEISRMHRVLARDPRWELLREHRFFQKGHHPRLFLLGLRPSDAA